MLGNNTAIEEEGEGERLERKGGREREGEHTMCEPSLPRGSGRNIRSRKKLEIKI